MAIPGRSRGARRAPPRLRPCAAAPVPSSACVALAVCALIVVACGAKPEPTSGKLDTTYPASVRDGSNRIITVEAPPRLVLVVTGGPERLLARLGVRAAVAPEGVTVARVRAAHPDLVVVGPGYTPAEEQRNDELHPPARRARVRDARRRSCPDIERGAVALGVLTNHAEAGRALALSLRKQREDDRERGSPASRR